MLFLYKGQEGDSDQGHKRMGDGGNDGKNHVDGYEDVVMTMGETKEGVEVLMRNNVQGEMNIALVEEFPPLSTKSVTKRTQGSSKAKVVDSSNNGTPTLNIKATLVEKRSEAMTFGEQNSSVSLRTQGIKVKSENRGTTRWLKSRTTKQRR